MQSVVIIILVIGKDSLESEYVKHEIKNSINLGKSSQWVKVETPKKGTQLINRNMIRNITFDNK